MLLKKTAGRRLGGFGMVLFLWTTAAAAAGAAGVELISRAPLRFAPDTTGLAGGPPELSADGRYALYLSFAPNLVPGQADGNGAADIFLHDRVAGTTTLVSHASGAPARTGERETNQAVLSADGRFVAFVSAARDILPGVGEIEPDTGGGHVYLWDRESGQTTLVTRRAGGGEGADDASYSPTISADGGVLVFTSRATDLIPGLILASPGEHLYAYERATGAITLVDHFPGSTTRSGNSSSYAPAVSADGRFVAYFSSAGDLVAGLNDPNGLASDLFLFDRLTGATVLVSHTAGSALTTPDGSSYGATLGADGRYVLFGNTGTDLAAGVADTNAVGEVFLYDRLSGAVTLVSLAAPGVAGGGFAPQISRDGSTALYFISDPGLPRGSQIVAYDIPSGSRSLVTRGVDSPVTFADRGATLFSVSADGRIVAFLSLSTNLVAGFDSGGSRGKYNVYVHDRTTGATVLASHAAGSPVRSGDANSFVPAVSADGSWIGYAGIATNLVAGVRDRAETADLFLYERATGANRAASLHPPGMASRTASGHSTGPSISADGRYVAFFSSAALIPGLTVSPGRFNVYLYDRVTRRTVLVSRSARAGFAGGDANSLSPRISRDGNSVAFNSQAGDLVPGQTDRAGTFDIFLWDRRTGRTTLVSHAPGSPTQAGTGDSSLGDLSADGGVVVFNSNSVALVPRQRDANEAHDVFLWDRRTGSVTLVSHHGLEPARTGNDFSFFSSLSPDGAFLSFNSAASDLILPAADRNQLADEFLYERRTGRVSRLRLDGWVRSDSALISAGGRWIALLGTERGESGLQATLAILERTTGQAFEVEGDAASPLGFSDDGRWLLFSSTSPDLVPGQVDTPGTTDLFLLDRISRQVRLVSHVLGDPLRTSGSFPNPARLSPDGRWVAFQSDSLDPSDPRPFLQAYLYDRTTEEVAVASRSFVNPPHGGGSNSFDPWVVDGGIVAFVSLAPDLVAGDFNFSDLDVFVFVP